jgi:hypothetical protein
VDEFELMNRLIEEKFLNLKYLLEALEEVEG